MSKLGGMTVNERLYATGLVAAWDEAVQRKDRAALINLLGKVELADQAEAIANAVLEHKT